MKTKMIVLAAMVAAASPAVAQFELNPSFNNPYTPPPGPYFAPAKRGDAEARLERFAQCVVRGDPGLGSALLASAPGSSEETALFNRIAVSRRQCLGSGRLAMKNRAMRGALAEQLYLRTYPDPVREPARPDAPFSAARDGIEAYQDYGRCVVARNPAAADAVVRAKPGSAEEKQAYQSTMTALSSCLAGEGKTLRIDRLALRGYMAEALYQYRQG